MDIIRGDGMAFKEIESSDLVGKLIAELPDVPEISAADLKARFDALGINVLMPKINELITAITNEVTDDENTILTGKAVAHFLKKELIDEALGYEPAKQADMETALSKCSSLEEDTKTALDKCSALEENMKIALHKCAHIESVSLTANIAEIGSVVAFQAISVSYSIGSADIYITRGGSSPVHTHVDKLEEYPYLGGFVDVDSTMRTETTTYRVRLVDELGHEESVTRQLVFCNGIYTGSGVQGIELSALDKKLQQGKEITFTTTAGAGEYIWYACPNSYGVPKFSVGGLEGGFSMVEEKGYKNPSGYTEMYQYWRSDNDNLGTQTVVVS